MFRTRHLLCLVCSWLFLAVPGFAQMFTAPIILPAGPSPGMGLVIDINEDAHADILVPDIGDLTLRIYLGTGTGAFALSPIMPAIGAGAWTVAAGDFNLDGHHDLVVSHVLNTTLALFLLQGDGLGNFAFQGTMPLPGECFRVRTGDIDGDLDDDIVATRNTFHQVRIFERTGNFMFGSPMDIPLVFPFPHDVHLRDLNNDNVLDITSTCNINPGLDVRLGNGDGTFQGALPRTLPFNRPVGLAPGDFNEDGNQDFVASLVDTPQADRFLFVSGNGDGTFAAATWFSTPPIAWSAAARDWNADGHLDVLVPSGTDDVLTLHHGAGDGTFAAAVTLGTGSFPLWVDGGDFNEDGLTDIAVSNHEGGSLMIFLQVPPENCANNLDDDLDGFIYCADSDCVGLPVCMEKCANGVDDDLDGFVDCADPDCASRPVCMEKCANNKDDDGDGLVDCADPDCAGRPPCP